jgi:hypothetical protein
VSGEENLLRRVLGFGIVPQERAADSRDRAAVLPIERVSSI